MGDESNPTTLYVGNLDHSVSEELICALFSQIGLVKGCKVIREPGYDPYAFEMKVNWATSPGNQPKLDTSNHHHIFVGDLSPEIETQTLRDAFAPFGEISNCRIVRDPQTLKSKGYAFVSFWLGSRSIRTNWSTRKPPPPRDSKTKANGKTPSFEEVYNQSSPTNCTVYCGGFTNGVNEELINSVFSQYGTIQDIRCFKDKGYAFIKFTTKGAATHAIENVHNTEINGQIVKCFWGKESTDISSSNQINNNNQQVTANTTATWPYMYGNMAYWYPTNYGIPNTMQYVQNYPCYGQFAGYSNPNYMNRAGNIPMSGQGNTSGWCSPPSGQIANPMQSPTSSIYPVQNYRSQ
ncbi:hypothetical protein O3M35_012412 [Rhynocoris fuscipes]|uniref:RRM domain-containing protein n=1 Tax=Rhynocoris fuscipes TaxID=488301 RepID=A0AAW1CT08_9HEMI